MSKPAQPLLLILSCLLVLAVTGCPKPVETGETGPGGLPKQRVEEGSPPWADNEFPVYPGAEKDASGNYITQDDISQVREYYENELGVTPVTYDARGEVLTFNTDEFELVLLPIPSSAGGGTEIKFDSND